MTNPRRSILALSLAVLVAACLAGAAAARPAGDSLSGAGSSFVAPLVSSWISAWSGKAGVQVTYSPIGSGGGIAAISSRTVDFGASDAPLTRDQFGACKGCVQIPWALSATSVAYNLPGVGARLRITGPLLASIFLGKVGNWNDRAIAALNPGVKLPDLHISPVYRSDGSGTTYNFTDFLSKVSPAWRAKVGTSTQVSFPAGTGARGSAGVAGVVSRTPGALTYVDVAYALNNKLSFFSIRNRAGAFVAPALRGIVAAAAAVAKVPADNGLSIVDPPASARAAYPISTYSYAILPLKTAKAKQLKLFVGYAVGQGQQLGPKLVFAPLPKAVRAAALRTLSRVRS